MLPDPVRLSKTVVILEVILPDPKGHAPRRTLIFETGSAIMIKNRKAGIGMKRNLMRIGGLTAGAVLIVLGIVRGEPAEIWEKAVRVCLECIGIG